MHVLVAGCGWLGTAIAQALVARGDRVTGVRRSGPRAAALAPLGIEPLALDLAAQGAGERLAALPRLDGIVAAQAAGGDSVEAYRAAYVEANRSLLAAAKAHGGASFVYTGSTGVFGQRDGSAVDEAAPLSPANPTAQVLAEAEALVRGAKGSHGVPACLVRLSGLYGPGRAGTLDRVRAGRLALGPGDGAHMNFCHREDAVAFVLAALAKGGAGAAYHGSDGASPTRREVVTFLAGRLGIEPVRHAGPDPDGPDRRILSTWTREMLGVALRYPTFREGFGALLTAGAAG